MRERSRVEIQLHSVLSRPLHPTFEVLHLYLVAVYERTAEITVYFVQVQAMLTGNVRSGFQNIAAQLLHIACLAGIITGSLDAAGQRAARLEADNVVRLPAMHGDCYFLELLHYLFYIHPKSGITFFGYLIGLCY